MTCRFFAAPILPLSTKNSSASLSRAATQTFRSLSIQFHQTSLLAIIEHERGDHSESIRLDGFDCLKLGLNELTEPYPKAAQ